jgi:hypothetical protein
MISHEMRAESRTDSTIFAAPGGLRNQMDVPVPISNMARVIPNRTDGEGPRESLMINNTTLCDLRSFVRSFACAPDDRPIYRHLLIPNPGRENPDRGTQLRGVRLNGDR